MTLVSLRKINIARTSRMESSAPPPSYLKLFWTQLYRHRFIVTIPPLFFYAIYADYSHTQRWKQSKIENKQS